MNWTATDANYFVSARKDILFRFAVQGANVSMSKLEFDVGLLSGPDSQPPTPRGWADRFATGLFPVWL